MLVAYAFSLPSLCFASAFSLFSSDMQFISVAVMEKQMCKSSSCFLPGTSREMCAQAHRNVALGFCLRVRKDISIWYMKGHDPGSE